MSRETSPYIVGDFWLDKRRDGASPDIWQIARYAAGSRSVVYRSTRTKCLTEAKPVLDAHFEAERAKQRQDPREALVVPMLLLYWDEKGRKNKNRDQTARSLRTFIGFLLHDRIGANAVVTDLVPTVFERFREWRMGKHGFDVGWGGKDYVYQSDGVSGDTVDRNLNDIRAAINHAQDNMRIPYAPKVRAVSQVHLNPYRERVLTIEELGRMAWYCAQFKPLFRFFALQLCTSVRPEAAKAFNPITQYDDRFGLIDLQPDQKGRTKKRNAIIPAIRPMRVVLRQWAKEGYAPVASNKTAWRKMRRVLGLSDDVFPKTIRHTVATWLYNDPTVPERQVSEMLGHEGKLSRTTRLYAKYDPNRMAEAVRALTRIWVAVSAEARRYGADHLLTSERDASGKWLARESRKV